MSLFPCFFPFPQPRCTLPGGSRWSSSGGESLTAPQQLAPHQLPGDPGKHNHPPGRGNTPGLVMQSPPGREEEDEEEEDAAS